MECAWKELINILPIGIRSDVNCAECSDLQEIRLRKGMPAVMKMKSGAVPLKSVVSSEDLEWCIRMASHYSPWNALSAAQGYLTAPGGHRIGICGEVIYQNGEIIGMRDIQSLCIRIAKDFPGISHGITGCSMIILGAPGWGKTTLLRDLIRNISKNKNVAVVDERKELFPEGIQRGRGTDVLWNCKKEDGIDRVLRTMGPEVIAVDEITSKKDCEGLINAANCGVQLLASAHAGSIAEFRCREIYRPLITERIFEKALMLNKDQKFTEELL